MPPTRTKKIINLVAIIFRICRAFSTDPIIKLIIDLAHAVQSWCVTFPRARARSLATFNINRGVMKCVNIKIKKLFQLLIPRVRPAITERKREKCILGSRFLRTINKWYAKDKYFIRVYTTAVSSSFSSYSYSSASSSSFPSLPPSLITLPSSSFVLPTHAMQRG